MFPFPFCGSSCWDNEHSSPKAYRERKLKFLKWMRDEVEARLAALNAAIETIERQMSQEET
jgi:hypothetical protein